MILRLWFTVLLGCYTLYTDLVPNLVIFSLILAQYTLVPLFPYLKSHWAQNVVAYKMHS
jgi:hypothetical protein